MSALGFGVWLKSNKKKQSRLDMGGQVTRKTLFQFVLGLLQKLVSGSCKRRRCLHLTFSPPSLSTHTWYLSQVPQVVPVEKKYVMWRNFRFLHICRVEKSEIAPHPSCGENSDFSTWQMWRIGFVSTWWMWSNSTFVHMTDVENMSFLHMMDVEKFHIFLQDRCGEKSYSPHLSCREIWHFFASVMWTLWWQRSSGKRSPAYLSSPELDPSSPYLPNR